MYNNINILSKALNASWKRNEVINNNIANANTPDFKRSDVAFENILKEKLSNKNIEGFTTHSNHISINNKSLNDLDYKVVKKDGFSTRIDKNNVDIDVEMAERAKNEIYYNAVTSRIQSNFQKIKLVINEGR